MPRFYVEGRIGLSVGVEITAKTLADVVERASKMEMTDFVTVEGDHNDSNFRVSGVHELGGAPKL